MCSPKITFENSWKHHILREEINSKLKIIFVVLQTFIRYTDNVSFSHGHTSMSRNKILLHSRNTECNNFSIYIIIIFFKSFESNWFNILLFQFKNNYLFKMYNNNVHNTLISSCQSVYLFFRLKWKWEWRYIHTRKHFWLILDLGLHIWLLIGRWIRMCRLI